MNNFLKINRALVAKKKLTFLLTFLCLSAGVWADYVDYISLTSLDSYTQDFNGIGGEDVTTQMIDERDSEKKSYNRDTDLPDGWRIEKITSYPHNIGTFSSVSTKTTYIGGTSLLGTARNGLWNFGAIGSTDRAIGGLSTGTATGSGSDSRGINVMARLHNDAEQTIKSISLSYDIEKYRYGANAAGFAVQLYVSSDGETWSSAGSEFYTLFAKGENETTIGAETVPIETRNVSGLFNVTFPANEDLYLAWNIAVASGNDCSKAQGLAIDNVSITPSATRIPPTYAIMVTDNGTITENFDCLGGNDVTESQIDADSKHSFERASTLPEGWKIGINSSEPRVVTSFAAASNSTLYIGGVSLPSNAKNGSWNFGETGSTDRALGGLTTDADNAPKTRGLNVMAHLYNDSHADIETLELSYDIEKYRNGDNANGFTVQLWTSTNGEDWTSAGSDFTSSFDADANSTGYANVSNPPTTHVNNTLSVTFPAESDLYLAWNISVSSGSACNKAQGLALDNVSIKTAPTARTTGDGWASFSADKNLKAPVGVTVYKASYLNDGATETLVLDEIPNRVIPANTGVLMQGTANDLIKAFADATDEEVAAADYSGNSLEASVERTNLTFDKDYFCMRYFDEIGTVFQLYTGAYIPAGKAYLKLDKLGGVSSAPSRRMMIVVRDDMPSGVEAVTGLRDSGAKKVMKNGQLFIHRGEEVYTIYGARVR